MTLQERHFRSALASPKAVDNLAPGDTQEPGAWFHSLPPSSCERRKIDLGGDVLGILRTCQAAQRVSVDLMTAETLDLLSWELGGRRLIKMVKKCHSSLCCGNRSPSMHCLHNSFAREHDSSRPILGWLPKFVVTYHGRVRSPRRGPETGLTKLASSGFESGPMHPERLAADDQEPRRSWVDASFGSTDLGGDDEIRTARLLIVV